MLRQSAPGAHQIGPFPHHARALAGPLFGTTRRRLMMDQRHVRCAHNTPPSRADAQAQVDVIVRDRKLRRLQPANRIEHITAKRHAGTGHRRDTARGTQHPAMAHVVRRRAAHQMRRDGTGRQRDAGVLHRAIWIQQVSAHDADIGPQHETHHLTQPVRERRLHIVVKQHDHVTPRHLHGVVVEGGPVEGAGTMQHPHPRIPRHLLQKSGRASAPAAIVNDDQLDSGIIGAMQNGVDTSHQQGSPITCRNDH